MASLISSWPGDIGSARETMGLALALGGLVLLVFEFPFLD